MGRPSKFSEALAEAICNALIEGRSLRQLCESEGFPSRATVLRWQHENKDFDAKCARARVMQADLMDDKIIEAAEACDEDNYQSTKVKISAYQWRASKLAPSRYGDKIDVSGNLKVTRIVVHDDAPAAIVIPLPKPEFDDDAA